MGLVAKTLETDRNDGDSSLLGQPHCEFHIRLGLPCWKEGPAECEPS